MRSSLPRIEVKTMPVEGDGWDLAGLRNTGDSHNMIESNDHDWAILSRWEMIRAIFCRSTPIRVQKHSDKGLPRVARTRIEA